jgi:hypothetical protein
MRRSLSKNVDIDKHRYQCHIDSDRYRGGCAERWSKERDTIVYNLNGIAWMIGRQDPAEERNRVYLVALHEAKVATEVRGLPVDARRMSIPRRSLAGVGSIGASLDTSACCA